MKVSEPVARVCWRISMELLHLNILSSFQASTKSIFCPIEPIVYAYSIQALYVTTTSFRLFARVAVTWIDTFIQSFGT